MSFCNFDVVFASLHRTVISGITQKVLMLENSLSQASLTIKDLSESSRVNQSPRLIQFFTLSMMP